MWRRGINKFSGNLILDIANRKNEFYRINSTENELALAGDLCYYDDKGAVCRNFNWQDGERTKIDENTKNAFCVIELLDTNRLNDLNEALKTLAQLFNKYLGAKCTIHLLDINNSKIELI
ncbi:phenylalanine--tRNA ligase beta subunit-related protein [Mycoplasmopsis fermentans]|uniref:phenylalanine--tRNA ligase beta subunit-related protein n=1 Tax=Mycoplasmopsis fermentans TaxID=2115 RepID=UPI0001E33003|nr:phenylalanine--tRNA ligase beta subunit-related protein [Mycoplasmopsis fermentans]ADN68810.1 putative Solo B3/4 domain (OB-fold DNA/RNA-binding) of Phe-aaRS-beta [Mycoplasmopsis fermentans JER]